LILGSQVRYCVLSGAGLFLCTAIIIISSFEAFTVGSSDYLLAFNSRALFFSVVDLSVFFAFTQLFVISKFQLEKKVFYVVCMAFFLIFQSALYGKVNRFPSLAFIGPEMRGMVIWALMYSAFSMWFKRNGGLLAFYQMVVWIGVLLILRAVYELVFVYPANTLGDRLFFDGGNLMLTAVVAILFLSLALSYGRNTFLNFCFFLVFMFIVLNGGRRVAFLIMLGGGGYILLQKLYCLPSFYRHRVVTIIALAIVFFICAIVFGSGAFLLIMDSASSLNPNGSDYEHLMDILDGVRLIGESPIMGIGMGVEAPDRYLNRYGWDTPFHSPLIHTWVRLGIVGFLMYCWMIFYSLRETFTVRKACLMSTTLLSSALSLGTYLSVQLFFPPFYLDPKQSLIVAFLLAYVVNGSRRKC